LAGQIRKYTKKMTLKLNYLILYINIYKSHNIRYITKTLPPLIRVIALED